jgi:hypothetical protein
MSAVLAVVTIIMYIKQNKGDKLLILGIRSSMFMVRGFAFLCTD